MKYHLFLTAAILTVAAPITAHAEDDWRGNLYLGASVTDGNANETTISANGKTEKDLSMHRIGGHVEYDFQESDGTRTSDEREVGVYYDHFLNEKWFINTSATAEQDKVNDLDIRATGGLGLGHQAYDREDLQLKYIAGIDYVHEEYENVDPEDTAAAVWQLDYEQKFKDDAYRLFHNHKVTVPFDDGFDAFLADTETGIKIPIHSGITASAQVDFDWNNDPAPGVEEGDTKYIASVGYEW